MTTKNERVPQPTEVWSSHHRSARAVALSLLWSPLLLLVGCARSGPPPAAPPPQVEVVAVHAQPVPLRRNLVGRLSATRSADVRARVAGVLLKRLYTEGSDVRAGQPLFQIDPAPLRAALDGALASLAQAEANAANAHVTAQRSRELLPSGLVSRSDLDNAEAAERSTAATVGQAKAAVGTARINLGYATVTAPIAGRAGQQGVTEGALVGQGPRHCLPPSSRSIRSTSTSMSRQLTSSGCGVHRLRAASPWRAAIR
jgi:membrane fusion protein (multidrug efflux system)